MRWRRAGRRDLSAGHAMKPGASRRRKRRPHVLRLVRDRRSWPAANRDPALSSCLLLLAALRTLGSGRGVLRGLRLTGPAGPAALNATVVRRQQAADGLWRALLRADTTLLEPS